MEMNLKLPLNWHYRCEGNNNIIFTDDNSLYILRVPKVSKHHHRNKEQFRPPFSRQQNDPNDCVLKENNFMEQLVYPILKGVSVHHRFHLIKISDDLRTMLGRSLCERSRMAETGFGIVMPNYCIAPLLSHMRPIPATSACQPPVICVELRPKSCYIPSVNGNKCCYFCMTRLYAHKKSSKPQTDYCPFDLYSGSPARIKRALRQLIAFPQRYFSLSVNDRLVFSHSSCRGKRDENEQEFAKIIRKTLDGKGIDAFLNMVCSALTLPVCTRNHGSCPTQAHCRVPDHPTSECGVKHGDYGRTILGLMHSIQRKRNVPLDEVLKINQEMRRSNEILTEQTMNICEKKILKDFQLARMFNCCSLIISFRRKSSEDQRRSSTSEDFEISDGEGSSYNVSIALIDLYKDDSPEKVVRFCRREQQVVDHYRNNSL